MKMTMHMNDDNSTTDSSSSCPYALFLFCSSFRLQLDGAVDEAFRNATPLHQMELFIQEELNKLQISVANS